jgi:Acyl-CoA synthetases (AMP-forming)/AMP-acid ligases II
MDQYDTSSLRAAMTGAASIPVETVVDMRQRLGFETVITAYGMTETHGLVTACAADDPPDVVASTSGKALPGMEMKLVDDAGTEVPIGEPGELLVRGYGVMRGYLDDPEQTAETIDDDGWMRTGDICVMNEDGYIDITDRKKTCSSMADSTHTQLRLSESCLNTPESVRSPSSAYPTSG